MRYTLLLLFLFIGALNTYCQTNNWVSWQQDGYVSDVTNDCDYTWITTDYALIAYNKQTGEKNYFSASNSGLRGINDEVAIDQSGNKWITTNVGLFLLDNNIITKIESSVIDSAIKESPVLYNLNIDAGGNVWFSNKYNKIFKYNPNNQDCKIFELNETDRIKKITVNHQGLVYALSTNENGGYDINLFQETPIFIATIDTIPFKSKTPQSFVIDTENNFWVLFPAEVTWDWNNSNLLKGGILLFNNVSWHIYDVSEIQPNDIISGYRGAFKASNGGVYLQDQLASSTISINNTYLATYNNTSNSIEFNVLNDSLENHDLLMDADINGDLYYYEYQSITKIDTYKVATPIILSESDNIPFYIAELGKNNEFWLHNNGKLGMLKNGEFTYYDDKLDIYYKLDISHDLKNILFDTLNNVWFVFSQALLQFDGTTWTNHTLISLGLSEYITDISHAQIDKNNNFWIQTKDKLLKREGLEWITMNNPEIIDTEYINLLIADSITYLFGREAMYTYNQTSWNIFYFGPDAYPDVSSEIRVVEGNNGTMFFSNDNIIYKCSYTDITNYVENSANLFTYNKETKILSWLKNDTIFQMDTLVNVIINPIVWGSHFYRAICSDNNGNIFMSGDDYLPNLLFNSQGTFGFAEQLPYVEDTKPATCGYFNSTVSNENIQVFPNPSSSTISLTFESEFANDFIIRIYDINGKTIISEGISRGDSGVVYLNYNIESLSPGMYFIQVNGSNTLLTTKFIHL